MDPLKSPMISVTEISNTKTVIGTVIDIITAIIYLNKGNIIVNKCI